MVAASQLTTPSWSHKHARAGGNSLLRVRHAQLRSPKDVDHVEPPGLGHGCRQGRIGRDAEDVGLVGVDRHALEALLDEIAEDAVRRTCAVRRCPDHGDPAGHSHRSLDARVVQDRDRPASLFEVEERRRPISFHFGHPPRLRSGLRARTACRRRPVRHSGRQRPRGRRGSRRREAIRRTREGWLGRRCRDRRSVGSGEIATRSASDASKSSAAPKAPSRRPAPEDHCGESDEAAPGGHVVLERPALLQGQVRPRQSGEDPTQDDVPVAQLDDVDPDRLGGLRVLADGPRPQAPARPEEPESEGRRPGRGPRSRSGPWPKKRLDDPADQRQVDQEVRQDARDGRCRRQGGGSG